MREKLKQRSGVRGRYKGTFDRYGLKRSYKGLPGITLVLASVETIAGEEITDHLWLNETKQMAKLGPFRPGDIVAFEARSRPYEKGYIRESEGIDERETDYKLSHPTKISLLERGEEIQYDVCPKCGYYNGKGAEACRRCNHQLTPHIPGPKLIQMTL